MNETSLSPTSPHAVLYVNAARQILKVRIPHCIGETMNTTQVAERDLFLKVPDYDMASGQLATPLSLHCVFLIADYGNYYSTDGRTSPILEARLIIDSEAYALGVLSKANTLHKLSYMHAKYPEHITFEITRIAKDTRKVEIEARRVARSLKTDEECLVQEVAEVFKNEKYHGSLPSTYVQSLVLISYHYPLTVPKLYDGKWHGFLSAHKQMFHLFKYSAEEIKRYNITHTCHANELRLALREHLHIMIEEDRRRDYTRHAAETQVHDFLRGVIDRHGECDSQFIMKELELHCPAYQEFVHPSFNMFERVIRAHQDKFFDVYDDPVRGTVVSLKK